MIRSLRLFTALPAALLIATITATPASAQGDALQEANQLFKQGQIERALERVDDFLKSRPKDARGRFLKGLILAEQNKRDDAIKIFTDLTHEFPELPEPYNNLAVLYASQGEYGKARSSLEMAIRTHPSYATAHENLGDIYAKMASQAYDKALQLDKGNTTAQTKLNLIKDLFSSGPRQPKPAAAAKPQPATKVAVATPAPKAQPSISAEAPAKAPRTAAQPTPVKEPAKPVAAPVKEPAKSVAAPVKEPAKTAPAPNPEEVLRAVTAWARAWSENNVDGYLARYADDFQTPEGMSRGQWEEQRRSRIAKPRKIQVEIQSPRVVFNEKGRVTVTFRQDYRSGSLHVSSNKTLVMVKNGEEWLIQQEKVGG